MPAILDHWAELLRIAGFIVVMAIAWTKLRDKVDAMVKNLSECKNQCLRELQELEEKVRTNAENSYAEKQQLWEAVSKHHENALVHITEPERLMQSEWRQIVLQRFDKIERMILKLNGSGNGK